MAKKRKTKNQIEYEKQVKRLKNAVRKLEKQGYIVNTIVIPDKPQRITKTFLQSLKQIKPKDIKNLSYKVNPETGELTNTTPSQASIEPLNYTSQQEDPSQNLPDISDIIISNFRAEMTRFPEVAQPIVLQWLNRVIHDYGKKAVAEMLENAAQEGLGITYSIAYKEDLVLDRLSEIMELLPDSTEGNRQDIMEALEYHEYVDYE